MSRFLKTLGRKEQFVEMCKTMWETNKTEFSGFCLFSAYGLGGNIDDQRKFASVMQKQFSNSKYLVWTLVCLVVQAFETPDKKDRFLKLAKSMFQKMILGVGKLNSEPLLEVYLYILQNTNSWDEIIEILEGEKGNELIKLDHKKSVYIAEALMNTDQWEHASEMYKQLLCSHTADEWSYYENYITCVKNMYSDTNDDQLLDLARIFFDTIEKDQDRPGRSLNLARCHIELPNESISSTNINIFLDCVANYFNLFGGKIVCFKDLMGYLPILKENGKDVEFMNRIELNSKETLTSLDIIRILNIESFRKYFDLSEDKEKTIDYLIDIYNKSIDLEKEKLETENGCGDNLLVLAVYYILDKWNTHPENISDLIECVLLLEYGLSVSPYNYLFKVIVIRLYAYLGCIQKCYNLWKSMHVKHIQMDALSHYILPDLINSLSFDYANSKLKSLLNFHIDNELSTPDSISNAFQNGSYMTIFDIRELKELLDRSLLSRIAKTENIHLQIMQKQNLQDIELLLDQRVMDDLYTGSSEEPFVSNLDWSILPGWEPNHTDSWPWENIIVDGITVFSKGNFEEMKDSLIKRNFELLLIYESLNGNNERVSELCEQLKFFEDTEKFNRIQIVIKIYSVYTAAKTYVDLINNQENVDPLVCQVSESLTELKNCILSASITKEDTLGIAQGKFGILLSGINHWILVNELLSNAVPKRLNREKRKYTDANASILNDIKSFNGSIEEVLKDALNEMETIENPLLGNITYSTSFIRESENEKLQEIKTNLIEENEFARRITFQDLSNLVKDKIRTLK
eukprot:TRINITY_DN12381_c0_g1_i1.p1 TRINITY_DN12381_c0_g1~~TRINITY_DN12381_c0_g1_i1.p1  ORF type:complete len:882 (-),score=157.40 TRINITY_DN12381_c0_g1_i1:171-2576(-)